jgi:hypothetical protein
LTTPSTQRLSRVVLRGAGPERGLGPTQCHPRL